MHRVAGLHFSENCIAIGGEKLQVWLLLLLLSENPLKAGDNRHSVNIVNQLKYVQILPQGESIMKQKSLNRKEA